MICIIDFRICGFFLLPFYKSTLSPKDAFDAVYSVMSDITIIQRGY